MSAQHTPGPWSIEGPDDFGDFNVHCARERAVVAAVVSNLRPSDEVAANAHVVSAAPEMLVQLKGLLGFARFIISATNLDTDRTKIELRNNGEFVAEVPLALLLEHSEAAVAKAEGRS